MRNSGLHELQAGIKIGRRNINDLRYVDDTTLLSGREEELKSLLMRVKEENERAGLRLNVKKTKITVSSLITAWQIEVKMVEVVTDFLFLGSQITVDCDCSHGIRRRRGGHPMRWLDSITDTMNMNMGKLQEMKDMEARHAAVHGVAKSQAPQGE